MANDLNKQSAMIVLILCWLFYLFSYFARVEPSVLVDDLSREFSLTSSRIGWIVSIAYIPYVIMQIPCGILTDKFGVRLNVTLCCLICSLGVAIFGISHTEWQLMLGRFLIGLAAAEAYLSCSKVVADMFDKEKYSMLMGASMFLGCAGGLMGSNVSALVIPFCGWRIFTITLAIIGVIIGIFAWFKIPAAEKSASVQQVDNKKGVKLFASNKNLWLIGLYGCMTYLPLSAIAELWGIPFLQNRFNVSTGAASIGAALIFIFFGLGSIGAAWVSQIIHSLKNTLILFVIGLIICFSIAIFNDSINFATCLILLSIGSFFAGANILAFTVSNNIMPSEYAGTGTGFMNTIIMTSGIVFQPLLGMLLDIFRNGRVNPDGSPLYTILNYRSALIFVILSLVIALLAVFLVKEKDINPEFKERA